MIRPINAEPPYCFKLPIDTTRYVSAPALRLSGRVRIVTADGDQILPNAPVTMLENFGNSWIKSVGLRANNTFHNFNRGINYYLKVQLSNLLNYDDQARTGALRTCGVFDIPKYEGYKVRFGAGQPPPQPAAPAQPAEDAQAGADGAVANANPPDQAVPPVPNAALNGRKLVGGDIWADDEVDRHKIMNYGHLNKLKERFANSRWNHFITDLGLDATRTPREWPNGVTKKHLFFSNKNACQSKYVIGGPGARLLHKQPQLLHPEGHRGRLQ